MYVTPLLVNEVLRFAEGRGVDPTPLLAHAGIGREALAHADQRLEALALVPLVEAMLDHERLHDFGGAFVHEVSLLQTGYLGFILASCANVRQLMEKFDQWKRLLYDYFTIDYRYGVQRVKAIMHPNFGGPVPDRVWRALVEAECVGAVAFSEQLLRGHLRPVRIDLAFSRQVAEEPLEKALGMAVHYDQPANALYFAHKDFLRPLPNANPRQLAMLEAQAREILATMAGGSALAGQVKEAIVQRSQGQIPELKAVARTLAMSPRSLQRRLQEEGTTFKQVAAEVQLSLAHYHLKAGRASSEVAYLLGFATPSAFNRWFKKETGQAPGAYKQA